MTDDTDRQRDWTTHELANYLGISTTRVRQCIRSNELKATKSGRFWLIDNTEVQRWVAVRAASNKTFKLNS